MSRLLLNKALREERLKSPLPRGIPLSLSEGPICVLIDADSLSSDRIDERALLINQHFGELHCIISANRDTSINPDIWEGESLSCEYIRAPQGRNEADRLLMRRGLECLSENRYAALLVCTMDRDLLEVALQWRKSKRASFISPLRWNKSAESLVNRAHRLGITALVFNEDRVLNVLGPEAS